MTQTSDIRKAAMLSLLAVVLFALWLSGELKFMRDHAPIFLHGYILPGSHWTNVEGFALLVAALFLNVFMLALLATRRLGLRQTGAMLHQAHKELQSGMPGVGGLRRKVNE